MQYDIKLVKLVSGDTVMGNYDADKKAMKDVVLIQTIPTASGSVQVALLPFGFPYEDTIEGTVIAEQHIMYTYAKVPDELSKKYLEAKSNIKIASSMDKIDGGNGGKILL